MKRSLLTSPQRGSALITAIGFAIVLILLVGSLLRYSIEEKRLNTRAALRLETRNAAEAVSEYGLAQVRKKMDSRSDFSSTRFTSGTSSESVSLPPNDFFSGSRIQTGSLELIIGLITPVTSGTGTLYYFDPTDPANDFEPLKGRYAARFDIRILSKATGKHPTGIGQTVYMTQTLSARASPLFSHAIFYNMDLEVWPGSAMNILGAVHTNGRLFVKKQSSSGVYLNFMNQVTAAKGVYATGLKANFYGRNGTIDNLSSYTDNVRFKNGAGSLIGLKNTSTGVWRDQKMGQANETDDTRASFRSFASSTYNGNLQSEVHGIMVYNPVAIGDYVEDPTPSDGVDDSKNDGRSLIERPLTSSDTGYNVQVEKQKYSTQAGLYIVVNPSSVDRTGHKPDGTTVSIPAGCYRAFRKDGTEVVLPGQPTYGANNGTVNTGTNATAKPVISIKSDKFTDIRRASNAITRSSSNPYTPKTIDTIEVDMTELKKAVDRTVNAASQSTVYRTTPPATGSSTGWSNYIYNPNATPTTESLDDSNLITNLSSTHWNGGLYIESVDAETRTALNDASGVRLVHGRGKVASASDGSGLTVATNDAMYLLGHFNADGSINTATTGTTNSAQYPETDEVPVSIAADAITVLSQPTCTMSGSTLSQQMGWNDALSGLRSESGSWSSSWRTTNPSNSNQIDGYGSSTAAFRNPTGDSSGGTLSSRSMKYMGANTEISAAMLTGIVASNKDGSLRTSGGVHNYPRFLEDYNSDNDGIGVGTRTVAIRGSMVCMFESRVATEPWSLRYYEAPTRQWGFNELFAQGKFPPLTPRVMSYRRIDFNDIPETEYNTVKTSWGL